MVDLGLPGIKHVRPALFSLEAREKLAPPPRGGAQESAMCQGHSRREGVRDAAVAVVVLC